MNRNIQRLYYVGPSIQRHLVGKHLCDKNMGVKRRNGIHLKQGKRQVLLKESCLVVFPEKNDRLKFHAVVLVLINRTAFSLFLRLSNGLEKYISIKFKMHSFLGTDLKRYGLEVNGPLCYVDSKLLTSTGQLIPFFPNKGINLILKLHNTN